MLIKVDKKHNRRLVSDIGTLQIVTAHCQVWTRESQTDIEFQTSWNRSRTKSKYRPGSCEYFCDMDPVPINTLYISRPPITSARFWLYFSKSGKTLCGYVKVDLTRRF